jgi:hypothetical protein
MQPTGFLEQKANNNNAPSSCSYKRNYIFNFFCFFVFGFDISWKNPSYSKRGENDEKIKTMQCSSSPFKRDW